MYVPLGNVFLPSGLELKICFLECGDLAFSAGDQTTAVSSASLVFHWGGGAFTYARTYMHTSSVPLVTLGGIQHLWHWCSGTHLADLGPPLLSVSDTLTPVGDGPQVRLMRSHQWRGAPPAGLLPLGLHLNSCLWGRLVGILHTWSTSEGVSA